MLLVKIGELESRVTVTYEKRKGGKKKKNCTTAPKHRRRRYFFKKIPSGTLKQKYMFKKYYQMN